MGRGTSWQVLNFDNTAGYTDIHAFHATLSHLTIYRMDDEQDGQRSAEVSSAAGR